jgi:hypothetical protein
VDLQSYPRPENDTGIGVHWNAGYPAAVGLGQIRDVWLPQLIALGIKWVKIARADGGTAFDELLLKHGIMPIVRLYRPQPNPGTLDAAMLALVHDHVAAGVRYFEFNNEPDQPGEWRNNYLPPDALTIVAQNAITDMEAILAQGGLPGVPALTVGSNWDLVGEICRLGRRDLFQEGIWQAVHNYALNHPLDYPYDAGNQLGEPYTADFYNRIAAEQWSGAGLGGAWAGMTLAQVNAVRAVNAHPGDTAFDDPSCRRAYERYDRLIRNQIGRSLPILATEGGYIGGEHQDVRYPATTPLLHAAQTLEACRTLMATSTRFERAPDWFFCSSFWLLGNYVLGHWAAEWEGAAWFSARWPGGHLPIVAALKSEPKQARVWHGDGGVAAQINGTITGTNDPGRLTVRLTHQPGTNIDIWTAPTRTDGGGRFSFADVPPGPYTLTVAQAAGFRQDVTLDAARGPTAVTLDLSGYPVVRRESAVRGTVVNGAGRTVRLIEDNSGAAYEAQVTADSAYVLAGLPAGRYALALVNSSVVRTGIVLDGENTVIVDLTAPGWGWSVSVNGASPGFGIVRCRVTGHPGVPVHLWADGWAGLTQLAGSKAEYGPDACEFAPLGAGKYDVQVSGGLLDGAVVPTASLTLDGSRVVWLTFNLNAGQPPAQSAVTGQITNGAGRTVMLTGPAPDTTARSTAADGDGAYRFTGLERGIYRLAVAGTDVVRDHITLDGSNGVTVDLALPAGSPGSNQPPGAWTWTAEDSGMSSGFSIVRCRVTGKPDTPVQLWTDGWTGIAQVAGSKAEYGPDVCEFAPLSPGRYQIEPAALGVRAQVQLAQNRVVWVAFIQQPAAAGPAIDGTAPGGDSANAGDGTGAAGGANAGDVVTNGAADAAVAPVPVAEAARPNETGQLLEAAQPAESAAMAAEPPPDAAARPVTPQPQAPTPPEQTVEPAKPARSRVYGRVREGEGRTVMLTGQADAEPPVRRTTTAGTDELYSFDGLSAGSYQATVEGANQVQTGIELNGTNAVEVDFDLGALGPGKTLDHYLLVGGNPRTREDFLAVLRYVRRFQPTVGNDETEARQARHVTILGSANAVSALCEQGLRIAGCHVQRIEGDLAKALGKLLAANKPY